MAKVRFKRWKPWYEDKRIRGIGNKIGVNDMIEEGGSIGRKGIAEELKISNGTVGKIARQLVIDMKELIGSGPRGLYRIGTREELKEAINYLNIRASSYVERASALDASWRKKLREEAEDRRNEEKRERKAASHREAVLQ